MNKQTKKRKKKRGISLFLNPNCEKAYSLNIFTDNSLFDHSAHIYLNTMTNRLVWRIKKLIIMQDKKKKKKGNIFALKSELRKSLFIKNIHWHFLVRLDCFAHKYLNTLKIPWFEKLKILNAKKSHTNFTKYCNSKYWIFGKLFIRIKLLIFEKSVFYTSKTLFGIDWGDNKRRNHIISKICQTWKSIRIFLTQNSL